MGKYYFLEKYRFANMEEAESALSEDFPHFFIRKDAESVEKGVADIAEQLNIELPQEIVEFWKTVGPGQFFCEPPDEYAGRYHIMAPGEVLGVYIPEMDKNHAYNTIRADAKRFLDKYKLLAFCEFDEYSALYISLQSDDHGYHPIFSAPTLKIANSLEMFVLKLLEEPDYFLDDENDDEGEE